MKRFYDFARGGGWRRGAGLAPAVLTLAVCLAASGSARAQVVYQGDRGGLKISAGEMGSASAIQYGNRRMLGTTSFVDFDSSRPFGVELEGRWLEYHQTANVHLETYSAGLRYHLGWRRFEPYAKGLIGIGDFNFPYNLASGHYLVVTAGGGLDYRLTRRITLRVPDVEYQDWPQFTYGAMTTTNVSVGLRVHLFGPVR